MSSPARDQPLVDALPYIDTLIDENEQEQMIAMNLVEDELEKFPPQRDYLAHLPSINQRAFMTQLIENEMHAIETQQQRPPSSELSAIKCDELPPITRLPNTSVIDQEDLSKLMKCVDQVKIKLEFQQRQIVNLDLLRSYGAAVWEEYNKDLALIEGDIKKDIQELEAKTQQINWQRKTDQERVAKNLAILNKELDTYIDKNNLLSRELNKLEARI